MGADGKGQTRRGKTGVDRARAFVPSILTTGLNLHLDAVRVRTRRYFEMCMSLGSLPTLARCPTIISQSMILPEVKQFFLTI